MASRDKTSALRELVDVLKRAHPSLDVEKTTQVLVERERLGSTAIGEGVAIPHGKLEGLPGVVGAFGRSVEGLDFDSYDEQKTYLFFVLLAPEGQHGVSDHLKALAKISRLLRNSEFRGKLSTLTDKREIYQSLVDSDD